MNTVGKPSRSRLAKPLAIGLAVLSLVFFLQIVTHGHNGGRQDGACRVCQLAHIGMAPAVATVTLTAPVAIVGEVTTEIAATATQEVSWHSSPRAPPSSNA